MFEDGLSYPLRGEWPKRTLIGGLLFMFSFLLLPVFPVLGYLIRVLKTTVGGEEEPPAFDDWGELFITGLVGSVIAVIYSIVPFVLFGGIAALLGGVGGAVGGQGGSALAGLGVVTALLAIPVVFLVYYTVPAALTNYAIEGRFGAAFEFGSLKPVLLSSDYLIAVFLPLVVAVLLWIATSILSITVIGLVLVPFLQFYGQVAVFRMFGTAFQSVARTSPDAVSTTGVSPN
jgi:hypothetical protein